MSLQTRITELVQAIAADIRDLRTRDGIGNVKAFGAKGDGTTNDTVAVQAAINASSIVYFPPGTYLCGALTHTAKTELRGVRGRSIIKAASTLTTAQALLSNSGAAYVDTDLRLDGLVFDGSNLGKNDASQTRLQALVRYTKASRVRVTRCHFRDYGYQLLGMRSCRDVLVWSCEVSGAGYAGTTANGGSAIWANQSDADLGRNIRVVDCYVHDNEWHGLHIGGMGAQVLNNTFENNKETHVFSTMQRGGANPALVTRDLVVSGNICRGLKRKDISAHGLELQCWGGLVSNNVVAECEHGVIAVERSRDVTVVGNTIRQFGTNPPTGGVYGGIDIYCTGSDTAATAHVNVSNNVIGMDAESGLNVAGIRVLNPGGDIPSNVTIHDNVLTGGAFTAGKIVKTAWDPTNCRHWNNRGAGDDRPYNGTLTVSATGVVTISGIPFTPQWVQITAFVTSTTAAQISLATLVAQVGTVGGVAYAVDGTNARASGPAALQAVVIKTPTGTDIAVGALDSFTADGFRINFTALTAPVVVRFTAHP